MPRLLAGFVAFAAALVALVVGSSGARADSDLVQEMPPRDVGVLIQPSAAALPPLPADFDRIDKGWLVLEFPGSVRDRIETIARDADHFRALLAADLGQPVLDHVLVRVARTPEQMAELSPIGAPRLPYAAGIAYPALRVALLTLKAPDTWQAPDLVELLRHELTHVALSDAVAGHHIPRWFDEGLAIHESGELPWARKKELWDATLGGRLLPLAELDRGFPDDRYDVTIAYAEAADVVRFLMRDPDRARFGSLVERVHTGTLFSRALEDAYGVDVRKLEYEWREEVNRRFSLFPMLTGSGLLWVIASGLAVAAWWKRRKRARAKLSAWAKEEAEMDAVLASTREVRAAREGTAGASEGTAEDTISPHVSPGVPIVEHEGRWHTLH